MAIKTVKKYRIIRPAISGMVLAACLIACSHCAAEDAANAAAQAPQQNVSSELQPHQDMHPFQWRNYHSYVFIDDALPADATLEGLWAWDETIKTSGARSHTALSSVGEAMHGVAFAPYEIPSSSGFVQDVYLVRDEMPQAIMMKFLLENGEEVGIYWEGETEVVRPQIDEKLWYKDTLPPPGAWAQLEFLAKDIGLEKKKITGIRFIAFSGKAYWDRTSLVTKD